MCAFSILQKWSKIAKMTQDDLLTLELVSSERSRNTKQNTFLVFLKYIIFLEIEWKAISTVINDY